MATAMAAATATARARAAADPGPQAGRKWAPRGPFSWAREIGGVLLEWSVKRAGKRDSVTALAGYDGHSSGPCVAAWLEPPTRRLGGPRQRLPIWCCSA